MMGDKIYVTDGSGPITSITQIGATLEALYATILERKNASGSDSYTKKLLDGKLDDLLKKVSEESLESCLAAKECEMLANELALGAKKMNDDSKEGAHAATNEPKDGGHAANPVDMLNATGDKDSSVITESMLHFAESIQLSKAAQESVQIQRTATALDESIDHMRYEAADVIYHLLVLLARFGISIDELAAELNMRMREEERPAGCVMLQPDHIKRGK